MYTGAVVTGLYFVLIAKHSTTVDLIGDTLESVQEQAKRMADDLEIHVSDLIFEDYEGPEIFQVHMQDIPLDYVLRQSRIAQEITTRVPWEQDYDRCKQAGIGSVWYYDDDMGRSDPEWIPGPGCATVRMSLAGRVEY